jgi:autoinducer 2-degrading protein
MNVTLVEINIRPERVAEFLDVFRANHEGALKEPGNLRLTCCRIPERRPVFYL